MGFRPASAGMASIEWRAFQRLAFMAQVNATQNVFREKTGLETLDNPQVILFTGMHVRISDKVSGYLGLAEDLVRDSTPDAIIFLGLRWSP